MEVWNHLQEMKSFSGKALTQGLDEKTVKAFLNNDPRLAKAGREAWTYFQYLKKEQPEFLTSNEESQISSIQANFVNFYEDDNINPYVALAAHGPWIITSCGAVVYDAGGYGMLGFGHNPEKVHKALSHHYVMANIMTANLSQKRFINAIQKEIGQRHSQKHPFAKFLCMNSGSEAMTVACRIADIQAKTLTDPGGRHEGKSIKFLALKGSFHGRTERPAQASDSSRANYDKYLATFRGLNNLVTVEPNDLDGLRKTFQWAKNEGVFFDLMLLEPVQGEGNPGKAISADFYKLARELTQEHGGLLCIDSIQAGFRTQGYLSIVDYPGFENLPAPDMEAYSKALNAGQYPLSVLAMTENTARFYQKGIYGNTMTTNPRALEVAISVLESMSEELRENIHQKGKEVLSLFRKMAADFPHIVESVQGTGLLYSMAIHEKAFKVTGKTGLERYLRKKGLGVIHGGKNALRFTPVFNVTSDELELMNELIREAFQHAR